MTSTECGCKTGKQTSPEPAWITSEAAQVWKCVRSAARRSPQSGKIYVAEVRVLPQLPVCVVAHPGVILWLPVEAGEEWHCEFGQRLNHKKLLGFVQKVTRWLTVDTQECRSGIQHLYLPTLRPQKCEGFWNRSKIDFHSFFSCILVTLEVTKSKLQQSLNVKYF